ncbi:MAG: outer membrane beta-barrel protein [Ignavibacteriae bacterium]|nr:outer membrane beta-barrel protein [Ignavibacteriota bacterium]
MKTAVYTLVLAAMLAGSSLAQERTVVVERGRSLDLFSVRAGLWFPKDHEKTFTNDNIDKQQIDQSQAVGLDFHYRYDIGRPLTFDFSLGGWYSSYAFKFSEQINDPALVQEADAWAAIVPITVGLSVTVIPEGPIQPFAGAGVGGYVGVSGTTEIVGLQPLRTKHNKDKTLFAFGGYVHAGVDFFITPAFGINLTGKYQVVTFKEYLFTMQKEFTGLQVLAGITTRL